MHLAIHQRQRLLRRLCKQCRQPYECDPETARRFGLEAGEALYRPQGCADCRNTGYRGRVGVFEVIRITSSLAHLIQTRAPLPELHRVAADEGMKSLRHSALEQVRQGTTSLEEALGLIGAETT